LRLPSGHRGQPKSYHCGSSVPGQRNQTRNPCVR
jgi:hypothetical protein